MQADERDPALPAATPSRRGRRRGRAPITRELIVETALRLLDRDGLDELSMRRVAEELDTGAASLYWHVGSKDALLDLVLDHVIGEHEVPDPEPARWTEQLKELAHAQRATILRHRDIVRVSIGRIPMGPNALRYSERVLAILRAGGVPDRLAVMGQHLLIAAINGFTIDETGELGDGLAPDAGAAAAGAEQFLGALPADEYPNLAAAAPYFAVTDNDVRFQLLVDIFVDGLAQHAARER